MKNLNQVINDFINDKSNKIYLDNLNQILSISKQILKKKPYKISKNDYSISFDINESIKIIIKFLKEIDVNLSNQFQEIITMKDENGNSILKFINGNKSYYQKYPQELTKEIKKEIDLGSRVENKKIYIITQNTLDDIFYFIHEIFHYMNLYTLLEISGNNALEKENYTRNILGETVSITIEKLFGEYLVKNNYITQNDLYIRLNKRLEKSYEDAKAIIIESALLELIKTGNINTTTINQYLSNIQDQDIIKILEEELKTNKYTSNIIKNQQLSLRIRLKYVLGTYLQDNYSYPNDIQKFIQLHQQVGNKDANIKDTIKKI